MAEALLNAAAGDRFDVLSAGLEPGTPNPLAVEVMKELEIDMSRNRIERVFELYKKGEIFSYVIAVCDGASAEMCPLFPGILAKQLHWSFEDPPSFGGIYEERLTRTRQVRDAIGAKSPNG